MWNPKYRTEYLQKNDKSSYQTQVFLQMQYLQWGINSNLVYETVRLEPVRRAELLSLALNWLLSRFFEKTDKMDQKGKEIN